MAKENKTRTVCAIRCSHCKEFGMFENYTKADGHYNGIFLCKDCRAKGIEWGISKKNKEEPALKTKKKVKKGKKIKKVKKIEIPSKVTITSLLINSINKPAQKPN